LRDAKVKRAVLVEQHGNADRAAVYRKYPEENAWDVIVDGALRLLVTKQ